MLRRIAWMVLVATVALGTVQAGQRRVVEAIMARVNDRIITVADFKKRLQEELSQIGRPLDNEQLKKFAHKTFDTMVTEAILLERAKEKKVTVDDAAVDKAIQALRKDNHLTDDDAFKKALAQAGLTEAQLRARYRKQMLLQRVTQSEIKASEITEQELHDQYEKDKEKYFKTPAKVHLEQVFLPVAEDGKDRDAVQARALGMVSRLENGADIQAEATLAGVKVQDLGEIPVADLRDDIAAAVLQMKPGDVAGPFSTAGGYQIIRLVGRTATGYLPFDKVKEQVRRKVSAERYKEQSEGLVNRLKHEYLVETHPEMVDEVLEGKIGA